MILELMTSAPGNDTDGQEGRARVLEAASRLVASGGLAALTTRAVAAAASVQAPTLYRLFGDKRGLLNAVAEHGLAVFVADKGAIPPHPDPVQDLVNAWNGYVAFGLANPGVFAIMNEVGAPASESPAMLAGIAILRQRVERIARAGRLRIPVDRAVDLIQAMTVGTVTTLLARPEEMRDAQLAPAALDALLAAILTTSPHEGHTDIAALAVGLHAHLDNVTVLTPGERLLLAELLDRLAAE
jgi:AcrR family transcriptional regulator